MDKHIGLHLSEGKNLEPTLLFPLLKSFYDSGHARPKLFIKLQQVVVNSLVSLETNEVCALLRLYSEMEIQQSTFYENVGHHIESRLSELDETGLINALQAFKSQQGSPNKSLMRIITDLESIVMGNMGALQLETIAQIMY